MAVTTKKGNASEILQFLDRQLKDRKQTEDSSDADRLKILHQMKTYAENIVIDQRVKRMLAKRGEEEITGEIKLTILRLNDLYHERAGAIIEDDPEGDWAWCATCGMEEVNCIKEPGICQDCLAISP